jgi:hypothetical protein
MFITAFCDLSSSAAHRLNDDLDSPDALLMMGFEPDTEQRISEGLAEITQRVRANLTPLEAAFLEVDAMIPELNRQALVRSQLLFGCGHFEAAWQTIEPHFETFQNECPALYLNLGHTALAALKHDYAKNLLNSAVASEIYTFEDLYSAYLLSNELDQSSTSDTLLRKMKECYPNEQLTLELEYEISKRERDFMAAEDIARKLHLDFEAELWSAFAKPVLDLDVLEELANKLGKLDLLAATAALEYSNQRDPSMASYWAGMVSQGSQYESDAMVVRIQAFGSGLLGTVEHGEADIEELMPLLVYVAHNPAEQSVRFALDRLFEETLNEMDALALLETAITRLIPASMPFGFHGPIMDSPTEAEMDAAIAFVKRAFPIKTTPVFALGNGRLPEELRLDATPRLVNALLFSIQEFKFPKEAPQLEDFLILLKTMELVCLEVKDASRDLVAVQIIIQRLAMSTGMQDARNLGEEALRVLPDRQPEFRRWRLGLAWVAYSEAFARTGNAMAALRHLCLAMAALKEDVVDLEVFCMVLRICTRVLRDVGLIPLALKTIKEERRLRSVIGATGMLWQLEQLELTLRISEARSRHDFMILLEDSMRQLRALPDGAEKLPLVSLAVSLLRTNRKLGVVIPDLFFDELAQSLQDEEGYYPNLLRHLLHGRITKSELLNLISMVGKAIRLEDLESQFQPMHLIAEDAIDIACNTDDADLFAVAVSLQCQPVLALRAMDHGKADAPMEKFRRWALEELARGKSVEQLSDLNAMILRIGAPESYSLLASCETTIAELASVLGEGETVLLAAKGAGESLCVCVVTADGNKRLQRLQPAVWSEDMYVEWCRTFRNGYGRKNASGGDGWHVDEIQSSLKCITLGLSQIPEKLLIIPSASFFSFPFSLTDAYGEFLGRRTQITIAPSTAWLVSMRHAKYEGSSRRVAWLGSPQSQDDVIHDARKCIAPLLSNRGIEVINTDTPKGLAGSQLAILLVHGNKGNFDQFHAVTDGCEFYSPAEIAENLTGCNCVVVLVCYGSHVVVPARTNETRGLLTALLAVGVRSVIASAWPVTLETIQYWLPTFLTGVEKALSVGDAAHLASRDVDKYVTKDAAAWAALQVFGDATLIIGP